MKSGFPAVSGANTRIFLSHVRARVPLDNLTINSCPGMYNIATATSPASSATLVEQAASVELFAESN